jgi:hypothetical protein
MSTFRLGTVMEFVINAGPRAVSPYKKTPQGGVLDIL